VDELSHLDAEGNARMVDVSSKQPTERTATAEGFLRLSPEHQSALDSLPKGDPFTVAKVGAILAAKRTDELIPLCHTLPLSHVDVSFAVQDGGVSIRATAKTNARTGVEMEALTAVSAAALILFDMLKAVGSNMIIESVRLVEKTGGKRDWRA